MNVRPRLRRAFLLMIANTLLNSAFAKNADQIKRDFDIPDGRAETTLKRFSAQAGVQFIFSSELVRGVRTHAVHGTLDPRQALDEMLADTNLRAVLDEQTGALTVVAAPAAPKPAGQSKKTSRALAAAVAAGVAVLAAAPVRAQPAPSADQTVQLPQFTVSGQQPDVFQATDAVSAARIAGSVLETPASIYIVTNQFMQDVDPVRLYDALRYVPGISEGRGPGFSDRIDVRGYENSGRVVDNFSFNTTANFDSVLVDHIEVLEGPNTILAPSGTPGGTVNVITKSPQFTPSTTVSYTAGLYDAQQAVVDSTGALGSGFAYRFIGDYQDTSRFWSPDTRLRQVTIDPQLLWQISPHTTLLFKYIYADYSTWGDPRVLVDPSVTGNAPGIVAQGFQRGSVNGAEPWNYRAAIYSKADLSLNTALGEHWGVRLAADYWYDWEPSEVGLLTYPGTTNRYDPYTGILTPNDTWALAPGTTTYVPTYSAYFNPTSVADSSTKTEGWNQAFTVQNDYAGNYKLPWADSTTVLGYAFTHALNTTWTKTGTLPAFDLYDPVYTYPTYPAAYTTYTDSIDTSNQLYAMERLGFWDDRIFTTAGASRLWVDNVNGNLLSSALPSTLDGYHDTYIGGFLAKPLPNLSVYYTYTSNSNPTVANNVPLWQDGRQHEYGVKADFFDGRLALSAAHFQIQQTNLSIPNPEYQLDHTQPQSIISNQENRGFEFQATGGITRELSIVASLSIMRTRDSLGRRPRNIPDHLASVLADYRVGRGPLKGLDLYFGASYTGSSEGDAPGNFTVLGVVEQPSFLVPGYTTCTAGASYAWGKYEVRIVGDNVLNSDYLYSSGARFAVAESPTPNVRVTFSVKL